MNKKKLAALIISCPWLSSPGQAQSANPDFSGMWSDPPNTLEGTLCFFACFENSAEKLYALLDDPANDEVPIQQLVGRIRRQSILDNVLPHLNDKGRENFPLDQSKDPGFTECVPWGFGREIFAPHQLRIEQHPDHLVMQYGEWDITRIIPVKGAKTDKDVTHTAMGHSVAHYEGNELVIETTHITEGNFIGVAYHSDQLSAVERYTRSDTEEGMVLEMEVTFTDPVILTGPVVAKKIWSWAPDQEIYAYDSCRIPDPELIIKGAE